MAYKDPPLYNIDQAVGPGAPNRRTDVMLVQFFLREIYAHPDFVAVKPPGTMQVDGLFGSTTATWIDAWQKLLKTRGKPVIADGRVDPVSSDSWDARTGNGGKRYSFWHLNSSFRRRFLRRHDHLESDGAVPGELTIALRTQEAAIAG
jgi:hypothetical protein